MTPIGYGTAKRVVELGRKAFFGTEDADLPVRASEVLRADDRIPQFGYVGRNYAERRILLLGINPGNGPDGIGRTPGDARMLPSLAAFAKAPTPLNFVEACDHYVQECRQWQIWKRHCARILEAGRMEYDEIAFMNCLPWRTASESNFSDYISEKTSQLYISPLLEELKPKLIIAMGKSRVPDIIVKSGADKHQIMVWNRSQAPTPAAIIERDTILKRLRVLSQY